MVVTFQEDGVLRLYASIDEVVRDVEALDAERTLSRVFDDTGQVYNIRWIRRNRRWFFWAQNGQYTLVRDGLTDIPELLRMIRRARVIEPESLTCSLQEMVKRFEEHGAIGGTD